MGRPKKDPPFLRVLERSAAMMRAWPDVELPKGFAAEFEAAFVQLKTLKGSLDPWERKVYLRGMEHFFLAGFAVRGEEPIERARTEMIRRFHEEAVPSLLKSAEDGDKDSERVIDRYLLPPLLASENPMTAYLAGRALRKPGRRAAISDDGLRNARARLLHEKPDANAADLADKLIRENRGHYHPDTLRRRLKNIP